VCACTPLQGRLGTPGHVKSPQPPAHLCAPHLLRGCSLPGRSALILLQHDVTEQVEHEQLLTDLTEGHLAMLSQVGSRLELLVMRTFGGRPGLLVSKFISVALRTAFGTVA